MNVRVVSRRTRDQAAVWLWDWFGSFMLSVLAIIAFMVLRHLDLTRWWTVPCLVVACVVTRRVHVSREGPSVGHVWTLWFCLPMQRRRFLIRELVASHSNDWSANPGDPYDELAAGSWSLECHRAAAIAAWLRDASAELSTPPASVRPSACG